ncbi:MAG: hypothetical protein IKE85_08780 [Mogibacterium sp.]|nr:hypothetical protein [Mogibacterium sp.]
MKLKRWISKAIVLAMVVALMAPMPVAAKAAKGGKLVSSVTESTYLPNGGWKTQSKDTFKYDKKGYPTTFEYINYHSYFLGIPVGGSKSVTTAKYKYKGKTPKSMKMKDGAGFVTETRKYKKGRVVSIDSTDLTSNETYDANGAYKSSVESYAYTGNVSYNKSGLATAETYNRTQEYRDEEGKLTSEKSHGTYNYIVIHKKGVPSYILRQGAWGYTETYADGTSYAYEETADGAWSSTSNGKTETGVDDETRSYYTKFNNKGLAIEKGYIDTNHKTGVQKTYPTQRTDYVMKKGKVTEAIVYNVETKEENNVVTVTKVTPRTKYNFKYAKKKVGAVRYLSMINDLVGGDNGFFAWY